MKPHIVLHKMIHSLIEGQLNKVKTKEKVSRTQLKLTLPLIFSWYLSAESKRSTDKKQHLYRKSDLVTHDCLN